MTKPINRRAFPRHAHQTPIMFTCRPDHPYCYFGARMVNYGHGGVCFASSYPLEPGDIVHFNRASYTPEEHTPDTYKPHCVQVRWCRELPGQAGARYTIGVQFIDPVACWEVDGTDPLVAETGCRSTEATPCAEPAPISDVGQAGHGSAADDAACREAMAVARSRARKLSVLNRFAASVGSTLDLNEILQSICREMTEIFGARNTGIGLLDRKRTRLTLVAFYAADPAESDATGLVMPLAGNAATHRVVETGQAIVVPDAQNNPLTGSIHVIARERGTQCLMIVPLLTRGAVIGTIGMPTADKDRVFGIEDVALAQTIANQIAGAIANARLYEETERAREVAERDLEIGRKIQTDFFPESLPDIAGWQLAAHFQPARQVSGDFYDLFPVGPGRWLGLVIADVCDHGVGSALFMVLFRSLIRAYAESCFNLGENKTDATPEQIAAALSETIRRTNTYIATTHEKSGMFATLFFGILDPETGWVHYINCGHEAPAILDTTGIIHRLARTGPAVGLDIDTLHGTDRFRIPRGHTLFLYTDGTTDAQNEDGDYFSKKRLNALLSHPFVTAAELVDRVRSALESHVGGADRYDDVTVMAVRRLPPSPP